jgi:hypothetical protein
MNSQNALLEAILHSGIMDTIGGQKNTPETRLILLRKLLGFDDGEADVAQRGTLVDAIGGLTDAQAITVYKTLAPSISSRRPDVQTLLKQSDPNGTAASNGASAKALLKLWVTVDGDPDSDK